MSKKAAPGWLESMLTAPACPALLLVDDGGRTYAVRGRLVCMKTCCVAGEAQCEVSFTLTVEPDLVFPEGP